MTWLIHHKLAGTLLGVASLLVSIIGLIVVRFLVIYMPADYFRHPEPRPDSFRGHHPAIRWTVLVVKNALGAVLLVAGVLMLIAPGPGVLGILVGLSLMNFPGKRALERRLVSTPSVLKTINRLRAKAGREPLVIE